MYKHILKDMNLKNVFRPTFIATLKIDYKSYESNSLHQIFKTSSNSFVLETMGDKMVQVDI